MFFAHPALSQDLGDRIDEHIAIEGLQNIIDRALLHRLHGGLHVDHAGYHDDILVGSSFLDSADELGTVDPRHHEIRNHDLEILALEDVQSLFARGGGLNVIARVAEQSLGQLTEIALVIDCQNSRFAHNPSHDRRTSGLPRRFERNPFRSPQSGRRVPSHRPVDGPTCDEIG